MDQSRKHRRLEAEALQKIENNPLTEEDVAMFEMFDSEGYSDEQRRAYILKDLKERAHMREAAE